MKPEVITITRHDIYIGDQNDCWHCPAAIATQRHFLPDSKYDRVSIDNGTIIVSGVGTFICPPDLNDWISRFDSSRNKNRTPTLTFTLWNLPQGRADFRHIDPLFYEHRR